MSYTLHKDRAFYRSAAVVGIGVIILLLKLTTSILDKRQPRLSNYIEPAVSQDKRHRSSDILLPLSRQVQHRRLLGVDGLEWDSRLIVFSHPSLYNNDTAEQDECSPYMEDIKAKDPKFTCADINSLPNETMQCCYARHDCSVEGHFQYHDFVFCVFAGALKPAAMTILIFWWLFCFIGLAVCADDFFCPSLVVISKTLRLSPNVAGVTFLAFGNGAPDFFSAISALSSAEGDGELGVGGLFGAGMFVTSVVVGAIGVVKPFRAMARPFLRDSIFYLVAVYWAFLMMWRESVHLAEMLCYVALYVIYVVVVVVSGKVYQRQQACVKSPLSTDIKLTRLQATVDPAGLHENDLDEPKTVSFDRPLSVEGVENVAFAEQTDKDEKPVNNNDAESADMQRREGVGENRRPSLTLSDILDMQGEGGVEVNRLSMQLAEEKRLEAEGYSEPEIQYLPMWRVFLYGVNPINVEEWAGMAWWSKVYEIFKSPLMFAILLTCPVINYEDEELNNWNRPLNILHMVISPTIAMSLVGLASMTVGDVPMIVIPVAVGIVLAAVVFFTSENYSKPKYHAAFGYFGFLIALVWIYTLATEIVGLLETMGLVFGISESILGLTLLAWGNSIGDLISNTVMARQGFARMGFAACYGAPFFNLTLGFGLAMTIKIINSGTSSAQIALTGISIILALFLGLSLISSIIAIPLIQKFQVNRVYGSYLLCLYIVFIVVALLTETGVIVIDV